MYARLFFFFKTVYVLFHDYPEESCRLDLFKNHREILSFVKNSREINMWEINLWRNILTLF